MPVVAAAAAAALAATAAGTAMSMTNKPGIPQDRSLGSEVAQNVGAQIAMQPEIYAAESQYQPKYTELGVKNLRTSMLGTPDTPGLLNLYENDVYPTQARIQAQQEQAQREADVSALETFAPRITAAMRNADPGSAALQDELRSQALAELNMGSSLTPAMRRELEQSAAASQAASGRAYQPGALAERLMTQGAAGEALKSQRRNFATSMLSATDRSGAVMPLLFRGNQVPVANGQSLMGAGGSMPTGSSNYQMFPQYASDLYNTNYNARAAQLTAQYNQRAQMASSLMSMGSGMMGGVV